MGLVRGEINGSILGRRRPVTGSLTVMRVKHTGIRLRRLTQWGRSLLVLGRRSLRLGLLERRRSRVLGLRGVDGEFRGGRKASPQRSMPRFFRLSSEVVWAHMTLRRQGFARAIRSLR